MIPKVSPIITAGNDGSRYWLLVHDGQVNSIDWIDGERLLSLSAEVRLGRSKPQKFTFCPRGAASGHDGVTLFVGPDTPIELLNQYERAAGPELSHWFG
jgi:hypothetical protein